MSCETKAVSYRIDVPIDQMQLSAHTAGVRYASESSVATVPTTTTTSSTSSSSSSSSSSEVAAGAAAPAASSTMDVESEAESDDDDESKNSQKPDPKVNVSPQAITAPAGPEISHISADDRTKGELRYKVHFNGKGMKPTWLSESNLSDHSIIEKY